MSDDGTIATRKAQVQSTNRESFCPDPNVGYMGIDEQANLPRQDQVGDTKPYATFILELHKIEEARVARMDTRAASVITTSGTLVTLLLALAGLATRTESFVIPVPAIVLAGAAVVLFGCAALGAVWAMIPRQVQLLDPSCLGEQLWNRWAGETDDSIAKTAATWLALWSTLQTLTQKKAKPLVAAGICQVVAVFTLVISVVVILAAG